MTNKEIEIQIAKYRLFLSYDGMKYVVLHIEPTEYKIGEIMCEMDRVTDSIDRILEIILLLENFEEPVSSESIFQTLELLESEFSNEFGVASGVLLITDFAATLNTCFKSKLKKDKNGQVNGLEYSDSVEKKVLEKAGFSKMGLDTVGQALVTALIFEENLLKRYSKLVSLVMDRLMKSENYNVAESLIAHALFENGDLIRFQHIDYRIMDIEDKLENVYGIQDSFSLIMFEVANCINNKIEIRQCKNCGRYFPLHSRIDTLYCSFPFGKKGEKTCREIGAQLTRARKEHNDEVTKAYRKLYMRYKMATNRHPDDEKVAEKFDKLTNGVRTWRNQLANGNATAEEFLKWLESFEEH